MGREGAVWWVRGRDRYPMSQTAEGIRKVGILFRLLRNRRINPRRGGFLFIDEPEAHLHPRAEVLLADLLHGLARSGVQVHVATHGCFIDKRLEQRARQDGAGHALVSLLRRTDGSVDLVTSRLRDGLPADDPILGQAVHPFEEEVALDLQDVAG